MEASATIHASQTIHWTRCERGIVYATTHPEAAEPAPEHVSAWIGKCVHAWIAEAELPETPDPMRYDRITPTIDIAHRQIKRMGDSLQAWIGERGWHIRRHELPLEGGLDDLPPWLTVLGTLDLEVWTAIELWIIDLKTGAFPKGVWIQLGTYTALHDRPVNRVGCLHFPRVPLYEELPEPTLELRDAEPVMADAVMVLKRASRLMERPEGAIAAPGGWCQFCNHPTCAVRAVGESEEATS